MTKPISVVFDIVLNPLIAVTLDEEVSELHLSHVLTTEAKKILKNFRTREDDAVVAATGFSGKRTAPRVPFGVIADRLSRRYAERMVSKSCDRGAGAIGSIPKRRRSPNHLARSGIAQAKAISRLRETMARQPCYSSLSSNHSSFTGEAAAWGEDVVLG